LHDVDGKLACQTKITRYAAGAAAAVLLSVVVGRIGWQVTRTWATAKSRRARHAQGLVVVGRPGPSTDSLVVDDERAAVYCVPGRARLS
jgi:hypothetical protein